MHLNGVQGYSNDGEECSVDTAIEVVEKEREIRSFTGTQRGLS